MKKYSFWICIVILVGVCTLSGCSVAKMNKIKNSYSNKKVKKLAKEYIEDKYGDKPKIGEINTYEDVCGGMDATSLIGFKGFAIETDDYMTFMSFNLEGEYTFADNKQAQEIEKDLKKELLKCYEGEAYLSMAYIKNYRPSDGADIIPYTTDANAAYTEYYDGDLQSLFENDSQIHGIRVYIAPTNEDEEVIHLVTDYFQNISKAADIFIYEEGIYKELEPHFDDYDYMSDYRDELYCRAIGRTGEQEDIAIWGLQQLADGIYAKCEDTVIAYAPEDGMERIKEQYLDDQIAEYELNGSEKYVFLTENKERMLLFVDPSVVNEELEYLLYEKEENTNLCEYQYDEMITNISGLSNQSYYVSCPWGYVVVRQSE